MIRPMILEPQLEQKFMIGKVGKNIVPDEPFGCEFFCYEATKYKLRNVNSITVAFQP
jgi:hypothetical protein